MYRVGYRTASFHEHEGDLGRIFGTLGRLGYDNVELCLERGEVRPDIVTEKVAEAVVRQATEVGLRIHSVSFHGDGQPWAQRSAGELAAARVARWFGVDVLVVNAPPPSEGVSWEELVEHFREVAAAAKGVIVAVEPEPKLMVDGVADALRLMEEVGAANLGVNLDIGHACLTEPDLCASINALGRRIVHTHLEDIPAGVHKHLVPGTGDLPLAEIVADLHQAGFRGPLTIDLFGPYDDPEDVARQAVRATRDVIREASNVLRRRALSSL
jgi:sugar phosphate isomerase/epimerase